jgi:hypothetical protein
MKVVRLSALRTGHLYRLSQPRGHSVTEKIMSMKNSNDTIRNRTRDLPVCSAVPQPTTPLCAPFNKILTKKSPFSLRLTQHTSCKVVYITEGYTKTSSNWYVLGVDFTQPLALSAAHYVSTITDVRHQRVEVIFTKCHIFLLCLLCSEIK